MGSAEGVIDSYLFLFLEDLGATETLMGLTLTFTCLGMAAALCCILYLSQTLLILFDHVPAMTP